VRFIRPTSGGGALLVASHQSLEHVHEGVDVLEAAIDRGEADVGDLVEPLEPLHHEGADLAGGDLALVAVVEHRLGLLDDPLERPRRHRPLLARLDQAAEELLAVELLARAVGLDHHVGDLVDLLVGGEAAAALQALAPPADGVAVAALARVDHPVAVGGAERTLRLGGFRGDRRRRPGGRLTGSISARSAARS
jgi:hypothetical protein